MNSLFLILLCTVSLLAYNIDVKNAQIFTDPKEETVNERKSYFGFSVALYVDSNSWENSLILVGAPRANISLIKTVTEPGSVFKCSVGGSCKEWILDPTEDGDIKFRSRTTSQLRDNAWTGATISVKNGTNPTVVVCAPRWKMRLGQKGRIPLWYMNGLCYRSRANDSLFFERPINGISKSKIAPFSFPSADFQIKRMDGSNYYYFGMSQAGFSMHMVPNKEDLVLGSPGVLNWKGTPLLVEVEERAPLREESIYNKIGSFYVSYVHLYDTIDAIEENPSIKYSEYFGYSVSSGCYFRKGERWFSSGLPRGDNLNGRVLIFSHPNKTLNTKFTIKNTLNGEQHGEYFGSALASCDLNNDGKDDLVVAAPLWTNVMEEGRVYVFSKKGDDDYLEAQYIHGEAVKGRFGSAISCIGDIDYDDYGDIAIGAPYENNHGAIYIYRGSKDGLQQSQKILGSEFSPSIQGFGISISEARDIDGNEYPDIAVGAYLSDKVVLLRSKPVVTLRVSRITPVAASTLQRNSTFFIVEACFYYIGIHVPESLNVTLLLKIDEIFGRARLSEEANNATIYELPRTLSKSIELCENFKIYLNDKIQNFIDPIEIAVSLIFYSNNETITNNQFCKTCPIINKENSKTEDAIPLMFAVDCGSDDICNSKLDISMSSNLQNNSFVLGSRNTFSIFLNISNEGEHAYQTQVRILISEPLVLASIPPECSENSMEMNGIERAIEVTCDVGNPLESSKTIKLELATSGLKCDSNYTELKAELSTQSLNSNQNKIYKMPIHFAVDLDVLLSGKTSEDLYSYSREEKSPKHRIFEHLYEIQQFGSCAVEEVIVTLKIPTVLQEKENNIEIAKIIQIVGFINNQEILCFDSNKERFIPLKEESNSVLNGDFEKSKPIAVFETINVTENPLKYVPPENRSLYINCSNPIINCIKVNCMLDGLFNSSNTKILLKMELQSSTFQSTEMEGKDILFFVTEGTMIITKSEGFANTIETKSNTTYVGTTFLGSPIEEKIALWILVSSILLGILLLILLILILTKLGFFTRNRRKQLRALKADSKKKRRPMAEASSSRIALDQDY
ncbi:integrin alpha-8-like isoform X2 [Belonocnema kinseyi]|uniref:integrin alpha-8-like isoform X2 n=1 Tax=Belonocnema kinseyi TaxID=2817044 RepID=UPI00143D7D73|nr:integrin alpha-8-like isoform X2 [Belonocnema kinseyi]